MNSKYSKTRHTVNYHRYHTVILSETLGGRKPEKSHRFVSKNDQNQLKIRDFTTR